MSDFAKDNNTFDASWKLYDAERMANESLRQQLADAWQEIADRKADCETGHDHDEETIAELRQQLAEKDAVISLLQFALADTEALEIGTAERLAASQLQNSQLREALIFAEQSLDILWVSHHANRTDAAIEKVKTALALPQGTSALEALIAKAGEVMRERCADKCTDPYYTPDGFGITGADRRCAEAIRAIPGVTLEDLQK